MDSPDLELTIAQYSSLQERLVREFISRYRPADVERFRDVPDGDFLLDEVKWFHRRHGAGILFLSEQGIRVNAHVAMVQHPRAIDGGRIFQYLESQGKESVSFRGTSITAGKLELDTLIDEMTRLGVLRRCESCNRQGSAVFEMIIEKPADG
ncbi:MAG: hypothetical protein QM784_40280 [Polyangiaceae bacterium]